MTREPLEIKGGRIAIFDRPGLGIDIDRAKIGATKALYKTRRLGARDDAIAIRFLIPGWTFDEERPCLVR